MGIALMIGIGLAVVLGLTIFIAMVFRRVVEPNEVHIIQSSKGTTTIGNQSTDALKDGEKANSNSYYSWPAWVPFIGLQSVVLPLSVFEQDLNNYAA